MKRMYLILMLLTSQALCHAHNDSLSQTSDDVQAPQHTTISHDNNSLKKRVFVPLWAITPDQNIHNPNQRNLLLTVSALAGTALKMLIESGNTLGLIEGATNLIEAFITNNTTKSNAQSESFIQELTHFLQEQAQSLLKIEEEKDTKNQS